MDKVIYIKEHLRPRWRLPGYRRIFFRSLFFTGLFWILGMLLLHSLKILSDPMFFSFQEIGTSTLIVCGGGLLLRLIGETADREIHVSDIGVNIRWALHRHRYSKYSRFLKARIELLKSQGTELYILKFDGIKKKHDISFALPSHEIATEVFEFLITNTQLDVVDATENRSLSETQRRVD